MTHEAPSVTPSTGPPPSTGLPPSTGGAPSTEVEGRSRVPRRWAAGLRLMTPSGRARVPVAWALYDMANTVFSFAVVSVAMGLWLTRPERLGPTEGQVALGLVVALSVLINALVSPILGALSDRAGRRLPFLLFFTALCVVPTVFIGPSPAIVGLALFALANFAFQAALIYYDALLPLVSRPESRGRLSGIGVAVGYLGTITVGVLLVTLDVSLEGTFVVAGALFAALAVPIFVVVREGRSVARRDSTGVSWAQLRHTIRAAREIPGLLRFLVARFFYTDPINTVIVVMAVFAVQAIGLSESAARAFLL
nr:MFS transporter [Chloroflexota bacterium]